MYDHFSATLELIPNVIYPLSPSFLPSTRPVHGGPVQALTNPGPDAAAGFIPLSQLKRWAQSPNRFTAPGRTRFMRADSGSLPEFCCGRDFARLSSLPPSLAGSKRRYPTDTLGSPRGSNGGMDGRLEEPSGRQAFRLTRIPTRTGPVRLTAGKQSNRRSREGGRPSRRPSRNSGSWSACNSWQTETDRTAAGPRVNDTRPNIRRRDERVQGNRERLPETRPARPWQVGVPVRRRRPHSLPHGGGKDARRTAAGAGPRTNRCGVGGTRARPRPRPRTPALPGPSRQTGRRDRRMTPACPVSMASPPGPATAPAATTDG